MARPRKFNEETKVISFRIPTKLEFQIRTVVEETLRSIQITGYLGKPVVEVKGKIVKLPKKKHSEPKLVTSITPTGKKEMPKGLSLSQQIEWREKNL